MRYEDEGPEFDDGSSSRYDDERNETLRSFAEQLCGDPRTIRYEEDEWIMLADYADDVDNFYLYSEAVIRGLQAYPDSVELADRHLMLLNRICRPDELRTAFDAAAGRPGASKIARLYDYFYRWSNADDSRDVTSPAALYRAVRSIMLDGENLSDQESIESVRVLADMGLMNFVAGDMDSWTALMDYPETFRYELCATAYERYDTDTAIRLADILVENYPYNFRYWILKCRIELLRAAGTDNRAEGETAYDDAVNSVETALAINPDDAESRNLREHIDIVRASGVGNADTASIMVDTDGQPVDIETFMQSTPVDMILSKMSVEMLVYLFDSRDARALEVIERWIKREFDGYDNLDGMSAPRIYAFTAALYILDRVADVDHILDVARHSCKRRSDYDEFMLLELARLIERSRLDDADRLMTRVERTYGIGDASVAVLRGVLDRRRGRHARADSAYDTYRHVSVDRLVNFTYPANDRADGNPDEFATELHDPTAIDTVTAHFLTRLALGRL